MMLMRQMWLTECLKLGNFTTKRKGCKNLEENGLLIDGNGDNEVFQISKPLFGASIFDAE